MFALFCDEIAATHKQPVGEEPHRWRHMKRTGMFFDHLTAVLHVCYDQTRKRFNMGQQHPRQVQK